MLTIYAHTQSNTAQGIAATTAEKMLDAGCPICIRAPAQALCAAQGIIMTSVMTCARQKFSRPGWQSQCSGQSCRLQRLTRSQRGGQERERERERERIGGPDARTSVRFWLMAVNVIELVLAAVPRCLLPSLATIAIPWTQDPNCSEPVNLTCAEL